MSKEMGPSDEYDDCAPSYEESVATAPVLWHETKDPRRPDFRQQLRQVRSQRISHVIDSYIEPQLISLGLDGVYRRTLILLPSDALPLLDLTERNLVAVPSSPVTFIRLQGNDHSVSFWQQPAVINELEVSLKANLAAKGSSPSLSHLSPTALPQGPVVPTRSSRRSWLQKTFGSPGAELDPTGTTGSWNLGWRSEEDGAIRVVPLRSDEIEVSARLKDVAFRTETEMGLLATETIKCVWIEVEVGI